MWSTENLPLLCFMAHLMSTLLENPLFVTNKTSMLWVKAFHVIFVVCWFAGLFYLPRLYVYHAQATDSLSIARFKIMERRLLFGIMTPAGILATLFGLTLLLMNTTYYLHQGWMDWKLVLVGLLWIYH